MPGSDAWGVPAGIRHPDVRKINQIESCYLFWIVPHCAMVHTLCEFYPHTLARRGRSWMSLSLSKGCPARAGRPSETSRQTHTMGSGATIICQLRESIRESPETSSPDNGATKEKEAKRKLYPIRYRRIFPFAHSSGPSRSPGRCSKPSYSGKPSYKGGDRAPGGSAEPPPSYRAFLFPWLPEPLVPRDFLDFSVNSGNLSNDFL